MSRLGNQQVAHHMQHMIPAFFRRNVFFNFITEENQSDFIIVIYGGKSKHRADFRDEVFFPAFDVPNNELPLTSTISITVSSLSSSNNLLNG